MTRTVNLIQILLNNVKARLQVMCVITNMPYALRQAVTLKLLKGIKLNAAAIYSKTATADTDKSGSSGTICENTYVLCTSAPCIPDPSNPDTKAICACDVNNGKNFGMSECSERTPKTDSNGVTHALSNYSFNQSPNKPVLVCPGGKPCIIDPADPLKAICTCEIERKQPFITFGGECNTLTCDTAYWSGATVSDFEGASQELMKAFGLKENPAQYCPGQNPK